MKKRLFAVLAVMAVFCAAVFAQENGADAGQAAESAGAVAGALKYIAAAIAVGLACIAGGIAVAKIGAAAMGAMSENPEVSGKALAVVGLAEGICLWCVLVGVLILVL